MIKTFKHKGLKKFFEKGSTAGIQAEHADILRLILMRLDSAVVVEEDMNLPGRNLHPLKGQMKGLWSVTVRANWRITFKFEEGDAYIVNYEDYH